MSGSVRSATTEHPSEASGLRTALATVCISGTLEDKLAAAAAAGLRRRRDLRAGPGRVGALARRDPGPLRRPGPLDRPLPALPRLRLHRPRAVRAQPAARRAQVRRHGRAGHRPHPGLLRGRPGRRRRRSTCSPSSCTASPNGPRRTACASPTRRSPGAPRSTPTSSPGTSCGGPTTPRSACAWTASTSCPAARDPAGIEDIPGEKLFFLQLADAPHMDMDVLQWSRHHRLFPGQGAFDLPAFLGHVLAAGYTGPLSLEVFNDVFRQSDPRRAAVDARRSLLALREAADRRTAPTRRERRATCRPPRSCTGSRSPSSPSTTTSGRGRRATARRARASRTPARHRSKPVQLWQQGDARVLLNAESGGRRRRRSPRSASRPPTRPAAAAPGHGAARAAAAPHPGPAEADLLGVAAPDGTAVFFCHTAPRASAGWPTSCRRTHEPGTGSVTHVDHVALTQPYDNFDEAALFYRCAARPARPSTRPEIAAPFGLVRNRAVSDRGLTVRVGLLGVGAAPRRLGARGGRPAAHRVRLRRRARARPRAPAPPVRRCWTSRTTTTTTSTPASPPPTARRAARARRALRPRRATASSCHFYTDVLGGRVFFEVVQRVGGYAGYGEVNAPVRMAAHRRARLLG